MGWIILLTQQDKLVAPFTEETVPLGKGVVHLSDPTKVYMSKKEAKDEAKQWERPFVVVKVTGDEEEGMINDFMIEPEDEESGDA